MRNKVIIFLLVLLMINIYFWPTYEETIYIDEDVTISKAFNITLTGEVSYPGIYTFYSEVLLKEVIEYAGGITRDADISKINYNELIKTEKTINIKSYEIDDSIVVDVYNLNEISKKELLDLVGIIKGLTLNRAINIILYRQQEGLFESREDLLKVKEIGPKTYEQIKDYFKV